MIYRGFEIKQNAKGKYGVHSTGSEPIVTETFADEEEAMVWIDAYKRQKALGQ